MFEILQEGDVEIGLPSELRAPATTSRSEKPQLVPAINDELSESFMGSGRRVYQSQEFILALGSILGSLIPNPSTSNLRTLGDMDNPISATMPRERQWLYVASYGFMCLIFAGAGVFLETAIYEQAHVGGPVNNNGLLLAAGLAALLAIAPIAILLRYASKIVHEYCYDGRFLRFTTLGAGRAQVQLSTEILDVRKGGGRSPGFGGGGYWVRFRNGKTIYFEQRLPGVEILVERLNSAL